MKKNKKNWQSDHYGREKKMEIIKDRLRRQYFAEAKTSLVVDNLIDNAATLIMVNEHTKKEILKGKKPDSQYTARLNSLNRIFRDLERLREQPEGYDSDLGSN